MYVASILQPDETVVYVGRVHYIVYAPAAIYILAAVGLMYLLPDMLASGRLPNKLHLSAESFSRAVKFLSLFLFFIGATKFIQALLLAASTELVVTDRRVIAKAGITTTTILEMDCRKIASVMVTQSMTGQLLNYGWVVLRGFSGDIGGLPVIAKPQLLQQAVNTHGRW